MITPSKTIRRPLKFKTPVELHAELDRLRTGSYKKLGKWDLYQACRHLSATIEGSLSPAENDVPTPEESAMKQKFFSMIMSPLGMPEQLPIGNPALIPADDCSDAEIERLKTAFQTLATLPHRQIKVGRCGPVPVAEVTALHLMHCAHHLSFLDPTKSGPMLETPSGFRKLEFADIPTAIAEIDRLNITPHVQLGNWSLPQIAQHLVRSFCLPFEPPAEVNPTPEQAKMQEHFLGTLIATGRPPQGMSPPVEWMPNNDAGPADVQAVKAGLQALAGFPRSHIDRVRFGPVPIEMYRTAILIHVAHHLGFLVPVDDRRDLHYKSAADVKADINLLRTGYKRLGNWNLRQICRHLTIATTNTLKPALAPPTPEQVKLRPILEKVLATGKVPTGLQAPERALPPQDCTDADIDAFFAALDRFESYNEPTADHPRFGPLNQTEYKKMVLAHAAHHLSHLIPSTED